MTSMQHDMPLALVNRRRRILGTCRTRLLANYFLGLFPGVFQSAHTRARLFLCTSTGTWEDLVYSSLEFHRRLL